MRMAEYNRGEELRKCDSFAEEAMNRKEAYLNATKMPCDVDNLETMGTYLTWSRNYFRCVQEVLTE